MFYFPLKYMARTALGINFKNVYFSNLDRLPLDKPVFLVSNHPSAFIEPCIFGGYLKKRVYWLVRGDLFKKPIFRKLMGDINMIPIFRSIDGYDNVKSNYGTFEYVYELLSQGEIVHILAEGSTEQVKKPRPIKKGTARMSFGTLEKYGMDIDIHLVPCGMNYTKADEFRSDLMVAVGEPLRIQDYLKDYKENDKKAIRKLTADLELAMRSLIITVEDEEHSQLYDQLFKIKYNEKLRSIFPIYNRKKNNRFEEEFEISEKINALSFNERNELGRKSNNYFVQLEKENTSDFAVKHSNWNSIVKFLVLILGFVPFLIGRYLNYLPIYLAKSISDKKVKQLEFKASVAIAAGIGLYFVYFLLWIIAAIIVSKWWFWCFIILMPFLGYFSIVYLEYFQDWNAVRNFKAMSVDYQQEMKAFRRELEI